MPIAKNTKARQPTSSDSDGRQQTKVKPTEPNWQEWKANRSICTLLEGLLLAHNVPTSRTVLARLRVQDDPRVRRFNTHQNTAIKHIKDGHPLLRYEGDLPDDTNEFKKVELFLPDFVAWVKERGWRKVPDEFFALAEAYSTTPPPPDWTVWRKMRTLTLREALSIYLNADPRIHDQKKARLRYKAFFEKYDLDEQAALRLWENDYGSFKRCGQPGQNKPDHSSNIDANIFLALVRQIGQPDTMEFQQFQQFVDIALWVKQQADPITAAPPEKQGACGRLNASGEDPKLRNLRITFGALLLWLEKCIKDGGRIPTKCIRNRKINHSSLAEEIYEIGNRTPLVESDGRILGDELIRKLMPKLMQEAVQRYDIASPLDDTDMPS